MQSVLNPAEGNFDARVEDLRRMVCASGLEKFFMLLCNTSELKVDILVCCWQVHAGLKMERGRHRRRGRLRQWDLTCGGWGGVRKRRGR